MPLYHDKEIIRKVWELKRKHPDWGIRKIGDALGISKDKVHRIWKRIEKGEIEVTEDGKVLDRSKPKGIVAMKKAMVEDLLSQPEKTLKKTETIVFPPSDPLKDLLKSTWEIECDNCRKLFKHEFTDEEILGLEDGGYIYVECPNCKEYSPLDALNLFPTSHKVFVRMADVFRAHIQGSRVVKVKT